MRVKPFVPTSKFIVSILAALVVFAAQTGCEGGSDSAISSTGSPSRSEASAGSPGESELASILRDDDVYRRAERLATFLGSEDSPPVAEVKAVLNRYRPEETVADFGLLMRYWAEREPEEASEWSLAVGRTRFRQAAVFTVFETWARTDPNQALLGVQRTAVEPEEISRIAQIALVHGWFTRDRDELEEFIKSRGIGIAQQRAIYAFALSLISADGVDAGIAWAESQPEEPVAFRRAAHQQVMNALALTRIDSAISWCDRICGTRIGRSLRKPIMRTRLRQNHDGAEVLSWISKTPLNEFHSEIDRSLELRMTYGTWANAKPKQAVDWFEVAYAEAEDGRDEQNAAWWLDELIPVHAALVAPEDAKAGLAWVNRIEDETQREKSLIQVVQIWNESDPVGAEAWLEESGLSDEAKTRARRSRTAF